MNRRIFALLYAASGAAALVYEVAWTRLLTLQLGHTVAAASTVLAAFMGGLAAGFWLVPALGLRGTTWVGVALNLIAAVGALSLAPENAEKATAENAENAEKSFGKKNKTKSLRSQRSLRLMPYRPAPRLACT